MAFRSKFGFFIALAGAALAAQAADLRVALRADKAQATVGEAVTFTLTVTNPTVLVKQCRYDPEILRVICEMVPHTSDAQNVALRMPLPPGATASNYFTDQGAFCSVAAGAVTCALGTVQANTTRRATIVVVPSTVGTMTATATVDPDSQVAESYETNNTAFASVAVVAAPTGPLPDLTAIVNATLTSTNHGFGPIIDFDVWLLNLGDAPANNIVFRMLANFVPGSSGPKLIPGGGWSCYLLPGYPQGVYSECSGGSLVAPGVAHFVFSLSSPTSGNQCLTVEVDPDDRIPEKPVFANQAVACVIVP